MKSSIFNYQFSKSIHLVSIKPGQVRGNHYHPKAREWIFVFGGKGLVAWEDEKGEIQKQKVSQKEFFEFEIPAGTKHAVKNIDDKPIYVLAY